MQVKPADAEAFTSQPPPTVQAVLVYGPNAGLVQEYARNLLAAKGSAITEIHASDAEDDAAMLYDAAYASSLFGGGATVFVRAANAKLHEQLPALLGVADTNRNFIVFEAGELKKENKLRQFFEKESHVAALPCYLPNAAELSGQIKVALRAMGHEIAPDALQFLAQNLPADRLAFKSELTKLAVFVGNGQKIELPHVMAAIIDSTEADAYALPWAIFDNDARAADKLLQRVFSEDPESHMKILRGLMNHAQRLQQVLLQVAGGTGAGLAIKTLRPPLFFTHEKQFMAQLRRWPLEKLSRALVALNEAERACKTTGQPRDQIVRQLCLRLAA